MSIDEDYEIILNSNEFDEEYYRKKYNLNENIDAIYHYIMYGVDKKFNPSNKFDTKFYLEKNPDVRRTNINPLIHYILWGKNEGRLPKLKRFEDLCANSYIDNQFELIGEKGYSFPIIDSNSELQQHFNPNYASEFDYEKFSKNISYKKFFFEKYGIDYSFFIIPDKSIVCKNLLPFEYHKIFRLIDNLDIPDFTEQFDETHYVVSNNQLNDEGSKIFYFNVIKSIFGNKFDEENFSDVISHHKLELSLDLDSTYVKKPLYLENIGIPKHLFEDPDNESNYYYNKNSESDLRVLVFYNSNIEHIKNYFPFYFKEVFLFYDYGILNREIIKWFNPDIVLEIRNENFISCYNDPEWVNNSVDFLKDQELTNPPLNLDSDNEIASKKISVIIPVYNVENYLEQCLNSVINQTFKDLEIICVNDNSTDKSLEILKKYAKMDKRINIISTLNYGLGAARNYGLKQATGDYIFFLDSDDWIRDDALELLYNKISDLDLEILFYQLINYMDEDGSLVNDQIYDHVCFQQEDLNKKSIFTFEDVKNNLFQIPVVAYSKLYKREFIEKNNYRFPEGILYEDNEFFYNVFFNCKKAGFLKEHLLYRRRHVKSLTGQFNENQIDMILAMNNTINVFFKNNKYDIFKHELINHTFSNVMQRFMEAPLYFKEKFYQNIKNNFIGFNELKDDFEKHLEKNKLLFDLFHEHKYYIKFESAYRLAIAQYKIFNGSEFLSPDSKEYLDFKKNEEMKKYEIGIVIPIYNNGTLTHRTIMSIENQTFNFKNVELILLNDNSNDETYQIINEYAKKYDNVKAIHLSRSSGHSGTPRNIGLMECVAKYIMFLDHDDFLELNALEILHNEIISTGSDVVFGTYSPIVDKTVNKVVLKEKHGYFKDLSESERLVAFPAPSLWTKLFNRKFIKNQNILFPTILGEDAIFMVEIFVNAKGIKYLVDTNICFHDLRDSSTTNNVSLKYLEETFVSELYIYNYFKDIGKEYFYEYKGITLIDFVLDQLYNSNLTREELSILFDLMVEFMLIHKKFNSRPRKQQNKVLFDIIINGDEDLVFEYIHIEKKINNLLKRANEIDEKEAKLNNELSILKQENSYVNNQMKYLKESNVKLMSENNDLKKSNLELSEFKENVLNSNSWKATKPLRSIKPKFKNK